MAYPLHLRTGVERPPMITIIIRTVFFGLISLATFTAGARERLSGLHLHIGDIQGPPANAEIYISLRPYVALGPIYVDVGPDSVATAQFNSSELYYDYPCYMQLYWRPNILGIKNWYLEQAQIELCSNTGSTRNVTFTFNFWIDANKWSLTYVSEPGKWTAWVDRGVCLALPGQSNDTTYKQLSRTCSTSPSTVCPNARPYCKGNSSKLTSEQCMKNGSPVTSNLDRICRVYLFTSYLHDAEAEGHIYFSLRKYEETGPFYLKFKHGRVVPITLSPAIRGYGPWCYIQLYWESANKEALKWHLGGALVESCVDTDRRRNNTYILNKWVEPNQWVTINLSIRGEWTRWTNWSSCSEFNNTLPTYRQRSRTCDSTWRYCTNARRHCSGKSRETQPCVINTTTPSKVDLTSTGKQNIISPTQTVTENDIAPTTDNIPDKVLTDLTSTPGYLTTNYEKETAMTSGKVEVTNTGKQSSIMITQTVIMDKYITSTTKIITDKVLTDVKTTPQFLTTYYVKGTYTTPVLSKDNHDYNNKGDDDDDDNNNNSNNVDDYDGDDDDVVSVPVIAAIGGTLGGVILIVVIAFVCFCMHQKKKKRDAESEKIDQKDYFSDSISTSSEYSLDTETEHYYSILDLTSEFEDVSLDDW